jgi:hypothetical protein
MSWMPRPKCRRDGFLSIERPDSESVFGLRLGWMWKPWFQPPAPAGPKGLNGPGVTGDSRPSS